MLTAIPLLKFPPVNPQNFRIRSWGALRQANLGPGAIAETLIFRTQPAFGSLTGTPSERRAYESSAAASQDWCLSTRSVACRVEFLQETESRTSAYIIGGVSMARVDLVITSKKERQRRTVPPSLYHRDSVLNPTLVHEHRIAACGSPLRRAYRPCWRRGRVAEGGGLLNRYRVVKPYRGFESLRLRHPSSCPARTHR
jgi:hypothetical protein